MRARDVTIKMEKIAELTFHPLKSLEVALSLYISAIFRLRKNLQIAVICCRAYFTPLEVVSICTLVQARALRHNVYGLCFNNFNKNRN